MNADLYRELDELEAGHWWYQGMRRITSHLLAPVLDASHQDMTILDAGCGAGGNIQALQPYGRVFGFDYVADAVIYAAKRAQNRLVQADIQHLPYATNTFDLVTVFDVLFLIRDDMRAIDEVTRITRPGGHVFIRTAAMPSLAGSHDAAWGGGHRYTREELVARLTSAGLHVERVTYINSLLLPLIYTIRQVQGGKNARPGSDVRPTAAPINAVLTAILSLEAAWIQRGGSFPAGVSLAVVARKA